MKLLTSADLARLIKNARVQQGLTQQEVADAVGITRQSVARLERGNGGISFDTVLLILDHLGIHLNATIEHRTAALTAHADSGAAQAAADALAKRRAPLVGPDALEAISTKTLRSLPPIDTSGILKQVEATLDPVIFASAREAAREFTEGFAIPGSVLVDPLQVVKADSPGAAEDEAEADATGDVE